MACKPTYARSMTLPTDPQTLRTDPRKKKEKPVRVAPALSLLTLFHGCPYKKKLVPLHRHAPLPHAFHRRGPPQTHPEGGTRRLLARVQPDPPDPDLSRGAAGAVRQLQSPPGLVAGEPDGGAEFSEGRIGDVSEPGEISAKRTLRVRAQTGGGHGGPTAAEDAATYENTGPERIVSAQDKAGQERRIGRHIHRPQTVRYHDQKWERKNIYLQKKHRDRLRQRVQPRVGRDQNCRLYLFGQQARRGHAGGQDSLSRHSGFRQKYRHQGVRCRQQGAKCCQEGIGSARYRSVHLSHLLFTTRISLFKIL
mmetsp:Transcript_29882/g.68559  ORF Transcript_29882/g.68559 Transcript_29882/m.68559 type:complete len:308 (-) Transcript_29882:283-1206(-)